MNDIVRNIWMYWPDKKACQFAENVDKGIMATELPSGQEPGDLRELCNDKGGVIGALKNKGIVDGNNLLATFAYAIKPGDYVVARNEFNGIVGIGIVNGEYYYDVARDRFRHCRSVRWIDTAERPFDEELKRGKWNRITLIDNPYRGIAEDIIGSVCKGEDLIGLKSDMSCPPDRGCSTEARVALPNTFKSSARKYQEYIVREWAKGFGDVRIWDERPNHGVWLKPEYALKGLVFYEGFRDEIMQLYHAGHTKIGMNLLNNALRSEHIPYNLFFPMMKKSNKDATKEFFNELLCLEIAEIIDVKIEHAPQPKYRYLNDGTSFDTYVLYKHVDGRYGAIGIEVKYTEKEYTIGEMEYKNTHDESGNVKLSKCYADATRLSGYYITGNEENLVTDNLRQIWRNHILGASMVLNGDINHFCSLTVFPDANHHFHVVSDDYRKLLTDKGKSTFFTFTYEDMFGVMVRHFRTQEHQRWLKYLYYRYLFGAEMPEVACTDDSHNVNNNDEFLSPTITFTDEQSDALLAKTLNRGVSVALINAFKRSCIFDLWMEHRDELLVCVRNNYLNVYYRMNNISEVRLAGDGEITCGIHSFFLNKDGKSYVVLTGDDIQRQIVDRYEEIKHLVENKKNETLEKVTQQKLVMQNNASESSKWFCVDVEWARSFNNQAEKDSCMSSRMDIIAISKNAPHRVAVIELKYGSKSIDGSAGVFKHIQDFKTLKEGSKHNDTYIDYYDGMKTDICNIMACYDALGVELPSNLRNIQKEDFCDKPEFYIMTVDNNASSSRGFTPKQTMAAYLFSPNSINYQRWGCKRPARHNVQDNLGINVLDASSSLPVTFIFTRQNVNNIHIADVLEDNSFEIVRPKSMASQRKSNLSSDSASTSDNTFTNSGNVAIIVLVVIILLLLWFLA